MVGNNNNLKGEFFMKIEEKNSNLNILQEKTFYKIGDLSRLLGVHQQTLRNWERKKLIKPIRVGNIRIYTNEHIEICKCIKNFAGKGISLNGIKVLLENGVIFR